MASSRHAFITGPTCLKHPLIRKTWIPGSWATQRMCYMDFSTMSDTGFYLNSLLPLGCLPRCLPNNWSFQVRMDDTISNEAAIYIGVPRGSVISPQVMVTVLSAITSYCVICLPTTLEREVKVKALCRYVSFQNSAMK